ncbi:MAG: hypothetical protein EA396_03580 [Anaerolineaceae bacterium]|nr:MAG: hypothetical protein EA396_03580 [Anaerolineaceae bacterium]
MREKFVNRLITLHERFQMNMNVPTAIFGTAGNLQQSIQSREHYRVGVWPCRHTDSPALGNGLMSLLAYLLDSLSDARAYTLFVRTDDDNDAFAWSTAQFGIEDWQPENLNENIAVAAELTRDGAGWSLVLEVENDLVDEDDENSQLTLTYHGETLAELTAQLVTMATDIMTGVGMSAPRFDAYESSTAPDEKLAVLLRGIGLWQTNLTRSLMALKWVDGDLPGAMRDLAGAGAATGESFGAWAASTAIGHALLPGYRNDMENVSTALNDAIATLNSFPFAAVYIGHALYQLGQAEKGYSILEQAVSDHPRSAMGWLTLADMYRRGSRLDDMLDTFQRGIEAEAANAALYRNYGAVLELLNDESLLQSVILIDPEDYDEALASWEAIAAYDEALKLQPESLVVRQRRTQLLLDVAEEASDELVDSLRELIERDKSGEYVRAVVDQLDILEDFEDVLDLLEEAAEAAPERVDRHVNLAVAYMAAEEYELAADALVTAQDLTSDMATQADIARLLLTTEDPDFEGKMGEIEAQVSGGATINGSDIRFLEDVIDSTPSLVEAYILLGRALYLRNDVTGGLETLMDGYEHHPQEAELLLSIGQMLWETGNADTAMDYLSQGLAANPNYVPLLAIVGQYLFEDGQDESAKVYLARAEAISPRDPALERARKNIAAILAGR